MPCDRGRGRLSSGDRSSKREKRGRERGEGRQRDRRRSRERERNRQERDGGLVRWAGHRWCPYALSGCSWGLSCQNPRAGQFRRLNTNTYTFERRSFSEHKRYSSSNKPHQSCLCPQSTGVTYMDAILYVCWRVKLRSECLYSKQSHLLSHLPAPW